MSTHCMEFNALPPNLASNTKLSSSMRPGADRGRVRSHSRSPGRVERTPREVKAVPMLASGLETVLSTRAFSLEIQAGVNRKLWAIHESERLHSAHRC